MTEVAILREDSGLWRGLTIEDGVAKLYTPELWEAEARMWLEQARPAAVLNAWIPTICPRCCKVRVTPGLCESCIKGLR